jgi:hypothetical protein
MSIVHPLNSAADCIEEITAKANNDHDYTQRVNPYRCSSNDTEANEPTDLAGANIADRCSLSQSARSVARQTAGYSHQGIYTLLLTRILALLPTHEQTHPSPSGNL